MLTLRAVTTTPTKSSSQRREHRRRTIAIITGHRQRMYTYFKKNFIAKRNVKGLVNRIDAEKVEKLVKENIGLVVKEQQDATAPQQIQEFLRNYMQTNTITINPPSRSTIPDLKQQLYAEMYANPQARAEDPELFEVLKKELEKAQSNKISSWPMQMSPYIQCLLSYLVIRPSKSDVNCTREEPNMKANCVSNEKISPKILDNDEAMDMVDHNDGQIFAHQMLLPLYKICEGFAGKDISAKLKRFPDQQALYPLLRKTSSGGLPSMHHPIATALTTSATVPIVYMQQFWQTLKFDESKTIMRFKIDQHEVDFCLDTFRTVLQLPQATDNENESFVDVPEFSGIAAFLKDIGYIASLRILADFNVKNLTQPWQTLFKIISRCTTGKSTGLDAAKIGTLQILWGVVNKVHIDYAKFIWDDIIFQRVHPHPRHKADTIPFPRYTKLIINHILSIKQGIPKRANELVHTPGEDDSIIQIKIGCSSTKVKGMRIPEVLLNDVIRETTAYKVYDADFRSVEVPTIQPVESTQGTRRKTSPVRKTKTKQGGEKKGKQISVEKPVQTAKEIDQANLQEAIELRNALEIMANAALDREVEQMVEEGDNLGNLENISEENDEPDTRAELPSDDDTGMIRPVTTTPTKSSSQRRKHLRRTVANITGHRQRMYTYFKKNFIAKRNVKGLVNRIAAEKVEKFVKENIGSVVKEQLDATAPQQIQEFLRNYMQTNTTTINPPSRSTILDLKQQLYAEMYANPQARAEDPELFEVLKKGLEKAQGGSDTCNLRKRPRRSS
ncbi:hypothetical protein Tco_1045312 [Tanacetum coccineum]|uniref:Uncharacterized protein n=1 Tax=Tanacetum coccineum TaxID=301880 RepID=A0ABQ5GSH5_9ASTR